ncbi:hypothetical protein BX264_6230 [Streptomyces sp. 2333.5]|uniref:hypothetical protein n=1 Tax=unclassified Streptomyces TaxID=2593676 RepID=UPI000898A034|nr:MULTISPECIES: hypothetical protein [unclassified Streptomyces]PJJ05758.1 hypothetical protein BX264_6230 [Streptomyces sp. 2333.5]SEE83676.1 hypothetical protein SAMN05428943_6328 [Streptomyces sp. 2314.4]SEF03527.1 hypothetical protein SAMN05428942_6328 [Streptomyces sp. 2112.2]
MKTATRRALIGPVLLLVAALLAVAAAMAPGARAAGGLDDAATALKKGPVYVDPRAANQFTSAQADALAKKIKDADKPVFVAVLPRTADYPPSTLLRDLRTKVGISGVYAVELGDGFNAGADPRVMSHSSVQNLVGSVKRSHYPTVSARLNSFVDTANQSANGQAPASWGGSAGSGFDTGTAIGLGVLVVVGGGGAYAIARRNRKRRAEEERAALEELRVVVDEDITAFGEELDRLDFHPGEAGADDAMRTDYSRALDSYENAKSSMAAAQHPGEVQAVTQALEDGRFSLATLAARREGKPLPERRLPCFFDPRHGPSVTDVAWAPAGGAQRTVPVCAADKSRLDDGLEPLARTVRTASGDRPYWDAGPAYAPWAGGYFGGGLLPGLLVGTLLGNMMMSSDAYGADFGGMGADGGDYSGSDFNPDDFGGGFGDGGGFGGDGGGF